MKVLVTGGAGFIGSHLVDALVAAGHSVRVVDDFSSGCRDNLRAVRRDVELVSGNCADAAVARRAARGAEVVFHEAAMPSVARSVKDPLLSHRNNAAATLSMLEAARRAGVRRFLYAGSSSVYGDSPKLPKRETMAPHPLSPYGVGKLTGEQYVRLYHELYGLQTMTLRYFNVFGPRQSADSPYSGVVSLFVAALLAGQQPTIHGNGLQSRDFTYVANVVDANLRAMGCRDASGQAVNVATGRRITLRELLDAIGRELGAPARARRGPARAGDIRHSQASISRARRLLGYRPRVEFETGLRRTLDWYRAGASGRRSRRAAR